MIQARMMGRAVALATLVASAPTASAELFRCQQPDGSITFSDSAATCPGTEPHEPEDSIQLIDSPPAALEANALSELEKHQALNVEAALESQWRLKKHDAEEELAQVSAREQLYKNQIHHCNRGGWLFLKQENGIRKQLSCTTARDTLADLEERREALQSFLDHELEEECRRAGCLPGWIR